MLRYKIIYIAVFLASVATLVAANSAMALLLVLMLLVMPLLIRVGVLDNAKKITLKCEISQACVVGKEAKPMSVTVSNSGYMPTGPIELVLLCKNHMFNYEYEKRVNLCGSGKVQEYKIPLNTDKCGRSSVEIKEAYCYDIFNLFRKRLNFICKMDYTVYPPLPDVTLSVQKLLNAEFGGYNYDRLHKGSDNSEVFGVREYAQGDSLGAAHWKLSAKVDDIIIREWSRPNNFRIVLVFDIMKKDIAKMDVSFDVQKSIMGIAASASRELIRQGIGHNALAVNHGVMLDISIHHLDDASVMLDEMMSVVIPENNDRFTDEFLVMGLHNSYSKLIYIGPEANASALDAIAAHMDVTAIAIKDMGETEYNSNYGYPMYVMSAREINDEPQLIEL